MPVIAIIIFSLQFLVAAHALKNGHGWNWVFLVLFVPIIGMLLYTYIIYLPTSKRGRKFSRTTGQLFRPQDPRSSLKAIIDKLDDSDSIEYRIGLAKKLIAEDLPHDALLIFHKSLLGENRTNPQLLQGLAEAYFMVGKFQNTCNSLEKLIQTNPAFKSQEGHLLYARSLEKLAKYTKALEEYQVLADYYNGAEAKYRYARLLNRLGKTGNAKNLFEKIIEENNGDPEFTRQRNKMWVEKAKTELQNTGRAS